MIKCQQNLTGGQRADSTQAIALLEGFDFEAALADCGYDTDKVLEYIDQNISSKTRLIPIHIFKKFKIDTKKH